MKNFGSIIRKERENKGLLLRELAAIIDIDSAILSKIERGERKPTKVQVIKLSDALCINKEDLFVEYLSDTIFDNIKYEVNPIKVLKIAEKKIKYYNGKNNQ